MSEQDLRWFPSSRSATSFTKRPAFGELGRRQFFRIVGGGVVVVALLLARPRHSANGPARGRRCPKEVGAWLHIGEDGAVTVYTGKVEIGQNIRTSLTQVVAEELHTPVERIRLVMADTALDARSTWARPAAAPRRRWLRSSAGSPPRPARNAARPGRRTGQGRSRHR